MKCQIFRLKIFTAVGGSSHRSLQFSYLFIFRMTDHETVYRRAYDQLRGTCCSPDQLQQLKEKCTFEIKSKRRKDTIKTLAQLLRILEKRDAVSPSNLFIIASELQANEVLRLLRVQSRSNQDNNANNILPRPSSNILSVFEDVPESAKDRAYQCISEEIGQKWQEFARKLGIAEGYIDDLITAHPRTRDRVYDILRHHEQTSRPWKSKLLDALGDIRRHDLRKKIQEIFDTHEQNL